MRRAVGLAWVLSNAEKMWTGSSAQEPRPADTVPLLVCLDNPAAFFVPQGPGVSLGPALLVLSSLNSTLL